MLYHAFPEEIDPVVFVDAMGNLVDAPGNLARSLKITPIPGKNAYSIKGQEGFLCADVGGAIGWRPHCLEFEQFTLISMQEYQQNYVKNKISFQKNKRSFSISKIIHQTHDETTIPEVFKWGFDRIKEFNPTWQHIYWNAKDRVDFIYENYGWDILNYYLSINPRYGAARADLFRYLCIYKMGGVYLDLKSTCDVSFDNIIGSDDQYLLSQWRNAPGEKSEGCGLGPEVASVKGGEFQQWHIIAAAGHPFLEHVINNVLSRIHRYSENYFGTGKLSVLRVTGPYVYTMAIAPILNLYPHRMFDADRDGLTYSFLGDHTQVFVKHYSREVMPLIL
ncbi:glycosyltransferase family 32 protein [Acetobacter persici]|uniref:glycosyltransferase family 32 protein n=1 Tax=Acetobacter persici TaxID=1076596 RepID=UPI0036D9BD38